MMSFAEKFDLKPLPKIEAPEWVGENVRAIHEDVQKHIDKAQAVRDEVEKSLEKMSNELALADFTLPTPAEKAKTRAKLLQSELRAREVADEYYSCLRLEANQARPALVQAVDSAKQKVREGLFALGFEDFDPSKPFIPSGRKDWIDEARPVIEAVRRREEPAQFINGTMWDHERQNRASMQDIKRKLVEIRDSVVAELV